MKCRSCDGSGRVHSHNDKCWDCKGTRETTKEINEKYIQKNIIPEIEIIEYLSKQNNSQKEKLDL